MYLSSICEDAQVLRMSASSRSGEVPFRRVHTVEGHDESHDPLRDPGFDLTDIRNQSSVVHDAVEDFLHRHVVGFVD